MLLSIPLLVVRLTETLMTMYSHLPLNVDHRRISTNADVTVLALAAATCVPGDKQVQGSYGQVRVSSTLASPGWHHSGTPHPARAALQRRRSAARAEGTELHAPRSWSRSMHACLSVE